MTSFDFQIAGRHENHSGNAIVVDSYARISNIATLLFRSSGDKREVKIIKIGECFGPGDPLYAIWATYTDSGSVDYYYFAVPVSNEEMNNL